MMSSTLLSFPERQHQQFCNLVRKAVSTAARQRNRSVEDYLHAIYFEHDDPEPFRSTTGLKRLYQQYRVLVESSVSSMPDCESLPATRKAWLCYRIYLHSMTLERGVMSEKSARQQLLAALREYAYARGRLLQLSDEKRLLSLLRRELGKAPRLRFL